jgi:hypothetical protein
MTTKTERRAARPKKTQTPAPALYRWEPESEFFWPPRVVWAREQGWLNVRDPWGQWHAMPARDAPFGYARLASKARGR